ncbi:MAG: 50S ribosomal protein L31 [Candidatus Chisholmbacteria bacterium RIFCSPLOWO2_01_FULL_50_28]|uniref:Large ribosomal subunit protein bL31 n=1 Tax=Candidatus Chisholmbacteria bacterium RIFCSPHIGHO2_01_FULL_52_32 TaxID=1797591 RepID=A0A1G1VSC1_9BACT|nr:MAG: 50S ribosomal protein L31 [Candidatus Chisholmbacteria bacterium RIFCSPHIGHO2_01_FULL_52_32]OGY20335.1 MAG: 50S ribosomal protein L31 [Candidatus Chisholmbacteria bacterium RIFCSPLOWO2_01_FULL_50_28]
MKSDIHPTYYPEAKVTCACGNTFTIGSTKPEIQVDLCYNCHPFYTGELRLVDTQGRIERFMKKQQQAVLRPRKKKLEERKSPRPLTLKEMLQKPAQ